MSCLIDLVVFILWSGGLYYNFQIILMLSYVNKTSICYLMISYWSTVIYISLYYTSFKNIDAFYSYILIKIVCYFIDFIFFIFFGSFTGSINVGFLDFYRSLSNFKLRILINFKPDNIWLNRFNHMSESIYENNE